MTAVYLQRGGREYPAGGDGLGVALPDRQIMLEHVQPALGIARFWRGWDDADGVWRCVHEARLRFPEVIA